MRCNSLCLNVNLIDVSNNILYNRNIDVHETGDHTQHKKPFADMRMQK